MYLPGKEKTCDSSVVSSLPNLQRSERLFCRNVTKIIRYNPIEHGRVIGENIMRLVGLSVKKDFFFFFFVGGSSLAGN